ncbi:MAG: AAA family ATPase [Coriobacteriia bacterium]|nr:AAA family ATPase [Coriobacteriia bacterium]
MAIIVISDPDRDFLQRLEKVLTSDAQDVEVIHAATPAEAADVAIERDACAVVYGPATSQPAAYSAAERVSAAAGMRTANLLISRTVDAELLRSAMRSGFRDAIGIEGATYGDLAAAVTDACQAALNYRSATGDDETASAKVVTVFSTKGGVGKSVLASNLAAYIASKLDKRVVLLDLDLEFGDDAVMLGLQPTRTIYDAVQAYERLDAELLDGFMQKHQSGAKVLLAPTQPEHAESITTARVSGIIDLAKELGDIVLIDTPGRLDEMVLTAIDRSDEVLAVATMDLPSIKNTKVSLQKLRQLGYRNGLVKLVLNRADSKVFLEPAEVERAIGGEVLVRIPSDRLVPRSVNRGVPVSLDQPKSDVAKSLAELAKHVIKD